LLLEGKTVLITGASGGIGRAAARGCARHGANVAINYLNDRGGADSAVAEIEALGRRAIAVRGYVSDPDEAPIFVQVAVDTFGSVDVFISNAGICPFDSFLDMPLDVLDRTLRVNLHGAWYMTQAAARRMVDQGRGGALIAVSSISALVGGGMQTHYTLTNAGVYSSMQSCAIGLGPHGIRCNSVLPGTIETDINREDLAAPEKRENMAARIPLGRLGEPDDLTGPIVFLASDMARYVTGASLLVDGGAFVNLQ
jgi:L-rhamnose 1-dehydrogenase